MSSNASSSNRSLPITRSTALATWCFCAAISLALPVFGQEAKIDQGLKKRLTGAMQKLEPLLEQSSGRVTIQMQRIYPESKRLDGRVVARMHNEQLYEIAFIGDQFLKKATIERGVETLEVANSEYAFMLSRPKGGRYSISGIGKFGVSQLDDRVAVQRKDEMLFLVFTPYNFLGRPIWELIRDPGFTWIGIESSGDGEEERIRVDFSYLPQQVSGDLYKNWVMKEAAMIFAPYDDWKMVEYYRDGARTPIESFDDTPVDQLAFTKFCGAKTFKDDGTLLAANCWTGQEHSYDPVPKEEFYLSFYGFPEPEFGGNQYWSWIVASMVLGGGCLIAARQLLKRRSET